MKYFVLLLLRFPSPVSAQCKDAISTRDMEQAALLKKAQRAWLTYRDAQCEADYKMSAGGTAAPLALTQCRVTLTEERTKTLEDTYLNSNP